MMTLGKKKDLINAKEMTDLFFWYSMLLQSIAKQKGFYLKNCRAK